MFKLLTSVLMLLIAAGLFFGFTQPTYSSVKNLEVEGAQLDQILAEAAEFQKLKSELIARYNALPSDQLARLEKLLPDHVDNVRLILDVDSLAASDGLALENVIINSGGTDSSSSSGSSSSTAGSLGDVSAQRIPYDSLSLQFKTTGSYSQFVQFLSQLESSLRLVDVSDLSMQAANSDTSKASDPQYAFNVKVRTYWLK